MMLLLYLSRILVHIKVGEVSKYIYVSWNIIIAVGHNSVL